MYAWVLKKLFGSRNDRVLASYQPLVDRINELEKGLQSLSDEQVKAKTDEYRTRLQQGETLDELLPEAYATVKNACRRMQGMEIDVTGHTVVWDMIPYDVQLMGGIALHQGGIAEMQTGEGKTLVAVLPLYLNALTGKNCQLVTVNDYLALRDAQWVGAVLIWLGLTVGVIQHDQSPEKRREMYLCDVTYGTNSEFGFDYLRDMGMATSPEELVQRDYYFCIVDEIDSILIDEARTPLIISGPVQKSTHRYDKLKPSVDALVRKQNRLCTRLVTEAKAVLAKPEGTVGADELDDAVNDLMLVKMGMPKHKQLLRLMEDPAIRRKLERKDLEIHSDQNRGMLQNLKEKLYFSIDERAGDTDLSEMGRAELHPDNPDAFVLPDLPTLFSEIDGNEDWTDTQKNEKRTALQEQFDEQSETIHNISQLLRAYCLFEKDVHYVVQDNKVMIVDEFTGRLMPGRRFSEGLHQALEAKEDVAIERETQTLATVTIQNYFRMYDKLAGMTGTAETEAGEFKDIYKLNVIVIPTNRPCIRVDGDDRIFKTKREKYNAIVEEIRDCHKNGQPVLLGTVSVEVSEILSRMLRREKIPHSVLNAKNHQQEAEIVSRAGQRGAVTIATNMAGRGTDIKLSEGVIRAPEGTQCALTPKPLPDIPLCPLFKELNCRENCPCGLHVIGSERHDSRRIDRQLRGRCSRQGDPGSSRFYIALEDDLMRLFGSDKITRLMEKFGLQDGEELSHPLLNRSLESAQRRVEQQHYSVRKRTLQFDDVMNKQREVIYGRRKEVLCTDDPRTLCLEYVYTGIFNTLESTLYANYRGDGEPFDRGAMLKWLTSTFPIGFTEEDLSVEMPDNKFDPAVLAEAITMRVEEAYKIKEAGEDPEGLRWLERQIILNAHDRLWQEHLYAMDGMREAIYLRAYAQRDPLVEYKQEAFSMFSELMTLINEDVCTHLFRSSTSIAALQHMLSNLPTQEMHDVLGQFELQVGGSQTATAGPPPMDENTLFDEEDQPIREEPVKGVPYRREQPKVGRNDPCPCGSGKKFKRCCGR